MRIVILLNKNFIINLVIILFLGLLACDLFTSIYCEQHYKKELKLYGKNKTYFSVNADIIGLTALATISDIAIASTKLYQRLFLILCLFLAVFYSCRIMYLDWQDIISSAKKYYKRKIKSKNIK